MNSWGVLSESLAGQCLLASHSRVTSLLGSKTQGGCFLDFLGEVSIMHKGCLQSQPSQALGKQLTIGSAIPSYQSVSDLQERVLPKDLEKPLNNAQESC